MNKQTWKNRALSVVLTVIMVFSMLPLSVFAADSAPGTADNPLLISSAEEMEAFRDRVKKGETDLCARLTADIDLKDRVWTPVEVETAKGEDPTGYSGTFDGNGHEIRGLRFDKANAHGLFTMIVSGGTVQDLFLVIDKENEISTSCGFIAAVNKGTIKQCSVEVTATQTVASEDGFGLIVAYNRDGGIIEDCYAGSAKITDNTSSTWIKVASTVSDVKSAGIAYYNVGVIKSCFFRGFLGEGDYAITARNFGEVTNSYCFNPKAYDSNDNKYKYLYADEESGYGYGDIGIHYSSSYSGNKNLTTQNGSLTWRLNNGDETGNTTNNEPWRLHVATNWGSDIHDYPTLRKTDSYVHKNEDGSYSIVAPHFHEINGEQVEFKQVTSGEELCKINEGYVCLGNDITVAKAIVRDRNTDITTVPGNDITLPQKWQPTGKVTLCLNGHNIYTTEHGYIETPSGSERVDYGIDLNNGADLTLLNCNSKNNGRIGGSDTDSAVYGVTVKIGGTLNMENGRIGGCYTGVIVDGGTFKMTGGEIEDCKHIAGIEYRSGSLTLGGHAKVADNTYSQNILLIQNGEGRTPTVTFENPEYDAVFGICIGEYDGSQLAAVTDGRVAVTGENCEEYYKHLFADRFICGGAPTDYDLYLGENGVIEIGVREPHTHCLCGAEHKSSDCKDTDGVTPVGHRAEESVNFLPWDPYDNLDANGNPTLPTTEGDYYLTRSMTIEGDGSYTWEPQENVTLCLNGYTVAYRVTSRPADGNYEGWIRLSEESTLTVTDCYNIGTVACENLADMNRWINAFRVNGGTLNLYGGTVKGFMKAVYVENGTLNMYGGTLTENSSSIGGGGVYVDSDDSGNSGTFNMYGGKIIGNMSTENRLDGSGTAQSYLNSRRRGGGVYVNLNAKGYCGTFNMYGGEISGNGAARGLENDEPIWRGGGVYAGGDFTMTGGKISGNTAAMFTTTKWQAYAPLGGGVYVGGNFIMTGGEITGNSLNGKTGNESFIAQGGGVYVGGKLTMTGGTISANTVTSGVGGGVYVAGKSDISNATISKNTVSYNGSLTFNGAGGGIYARGTSNITSSKITDNRVTELKSLNVSNANLCTGGGGVYLSNSVKGECSAITDCIITGNALEGSTQSDRPNNRVGGGGVLVNQGMVVIENTTVTDNTVTANDSPMLGGGIMYYPHNGSYTKGIILRGNVVVKNNTSNGKASNLYWENPDPSSGSELTELKVTVGGALTGGAESIGMSGISLPGVIAEAGDGYTTITDTDARSFFDDSGRYVARLTEDNTAVQLIPCPHDGGYENGICKICGEGCDHPTDKITESAGNAVCDICGQHMAVKVEYKDVNDTQQTKYYARTYYTHNGNDYENTLQTLFNDDTITPSGSTVTLLTDDLLAWAHVKGGRTVTLNLNGKKLIETGNGICTYNDNSNNKLIVTGTGTSEKNEDLTVNRAFAVYGGTLEFDYGFGGKFNEIYASGGTLISPRELKDAITIGTLKIGSVDAKISFKSVTIGKIIVEDMTAGASVTLGDLLGVWKDAEGNAVRSGNAFRYTTGDESFVRYDTKITKDNPVENIKTDACYHDSLGAENTCNYCGWAHLVAIYITDSGVVGTMNPATEWTEDAINRAVNTAFGTWNSMGGTLRLFADATLADRTITNRYATHIDLNGNKITGGTLTLDKNSRGNGTNVTVTDSSTVKNGEFANVTVNGGASLTVDGVKVSGVMLKAGSTLTVQNGGILGTVTAVDGYLIDFLQDGYAFVGTDGKVKNARTDTLENVTVARHAAHTYEWNTVTHEHICGCGYVEKTDNEPPVFDDRIKNNGVYYSNKLTFMVTDTISGLAGVKDGGKALTADASGEYTIIADNKVHTLTATDNAGNITVVTVTVYKVYDVTVSTDVSYKISGNGTANHGQDYTFTVKISNGYTATDDFTVKVNGETVTGTKTDGVYSYTVNGDKVTGELEITVDGVRDVTAPEAVVAFGGNFFRKFLNFITFGLFFKDTKEVTVTASDDGSGIADVRYVISKTPLTEESVKTSDGLKTLTANNDGEYTFNITPKSKGFVYVIVRDNAGNEKVIDSSGVVIYTDSTANTKSVSFRRLADNDVQFNVNLNGNTVGSLICGGTEIDSSLYTVEADGTVTLKNEFLRTLAADKYEITVTYKPMGETYVSGENNEAPATTEVELVVLRNTRKLVFDAPNTVYDGAKYDELSITDKPEGTALRYKKTGDSDDTYTDKAPKNAGSYTVEIAVPQDDNYNARTFTADFTISRKNVTVSDVRVGDKVYDSTVNADIIYNGNIDGICGDDELTVIKGKAFFEDKNVGNAKTVNFSEFALDGADKDNYALEAQPGSAKASITAKELTVGNLKVKDKLYDGTEKAEIDGSYALTLDGKYDGDDVVLICGEPSFVQAEANDKNAVGVKFTEFTLSGEDSGNYTVAQPTGITAWIRSWNVDGTEFSTTTDQWSNKPFAVTADDGYLLSLSDTADGEWVKQLTGLEKTSDSPKTLVFYVKNITTGAISTSNERGYRYETDAPTGTITINERTSFQEFINKITFGLFFKDDVTVKLTANDEASGVKSVEYYRSDKALTLAEIKVLADSDWTAGDSFGITAEDKDMQQFVIYARITDNAGNITYLSSEGIEFDTTVPELIGVENGKTYYVTKRVAAYDENLKSVTVNGKPVTDNPFDLEGDKDMKYTVVITDKAGNVAEYKVIMKPISDITDSIEDITEKNVKSDDAEKIGKVTGRILDIASESDEEVIGEEQWEKLLAAAEKCKKLEKRIAVVANEIDGLTETVDGYDGDKVTSADKADIENVISEIEALLGGDNLTDTEKNTLDSLREDAKSLLDRIADAKSAAESEGIVAVDEINEGNVTADDKDALKKAEKELKDALDGLGGNYTEEEKKDLNDKLDTVKKSIDAIDNAEKAADEIKKLPDTDDVKLSDKDEIERVSGIVDALSENEKAMLGEEAIGKVKKLVEKINELASESDKPSPATGENGKLTLWFVLFALSGAVICTVIAGKKKKQADR